MLLTILIFLVIFLIGFIFESSGIIPVWIYYIGAGLIIFGMIFDFHYNRNSEKKLKDKKFIN